MNNPEDYELAYNILDVIKRDITNSLLQDLSSQSISSLYS